MAAALSLLPELRTPNASRRGGTHLQSPLGDGGPAHLADAEGARCYAVERSVDPFQFGQHTDSHPLDARPLRGQGSPLGIVLVVGGFGPSRLAQLHELHFDLGEASARGIPRCAQDDDR